jgi:NADH:ubiquinone oxidoreductase subunit 4 (subunit M)
VFLGRNERFEAGLADLTVREGLILAPLVVLTVALGVWPSLVLSWMEPSVTEVVHQVVESPTARRWSRPASGGASSG